MIVAVLLAVTIGVAAILNHRLGRLRRNRDELEKLTVEFVKATGHAEQSVDKLTLSTDALQKRIDAAQALSDDLGFLIDRGGKIADRIEGEVRAARPLQASPAPRAAAGKLRPTASATNASPKSRAEQALLEALQGRR
ncbi:MAG: DUF6468 domain-containing protein [Rhodospirillales bacterium]